ncbi:MAG TPA: LUD domain-containing protein, partial [Deltaproteobacteria bacterium]|nr:LUD domain-containing protein [Deltaproteobacteria bacterium]
MEKPIENFWSLRLANVKEALEANNFEVHIAENADAAKKIVREIIPGTGAKSVSWGGSVTYVETGLYQEVKDYPGLEILDTYEKGVSP